MRKLLKLDFSRIKDNILVYLSVGIGVVIYLILSIPTDGMKYGLVVACGTFLILVNDNVELEEGWEKLIIISGIKRETYLLYKYLKVIIVGIVMSIVAFLILGREYEASFIGTLILIYLSVIFFLFVLREVLPVRIYVGICNGIYIILFIMMVGIEKRDIESLNSNPANICFFIIVIIVCFITKWYKLKRRDC